MSKKWCNWRVDVDDAFRERIYAAGYGPDNFPVYTLLDHVSASGMSRRITAYILMKDEKGEPYPYCVARELLVSGCGFDAGHEVAYNLFLNVFGMSNDYYRNGGSDWGRAAHDWWLAKGYDDTRYQSGLKHRWL